MEVSKMNIPLGHPNRPGVKLESLLAIVFHYTANDRPTATDTMNAKYFSRGWTGDRVNPMEADGKTPFRYGSTQIIADMDSVTEAIPPNEAAWSCGDFQLPFVNGYKSQQPIAKKLFGGRQNFRSVSVEICNNDAIPNSSADWDGAVNNAAWWAIQFIKSKGLKVNAEKSLNPQSVISLDHGEILLLRHRDLTGKVCPKPFVDNEVAWESFVRKIAGA